jgi:ParB/RepB/Spo0J family partition protein
MTFRTIPLSRLSRPSRGLRASIDMDAVRALAESIREIGQLEPLLVRPITDDPDRYEIVAGERRFLALGLAGKSTADVRIDSEFATAHATAENTAREALTPLEEARAYRMLVEDERIDEEEVAARVGRSTSYVAARLRLAYLDEATLALLTAKRIGYREAAFLAGVHADVRARVVAKLTSGRGEIDMATLRDEVESAALDLDGAPFDTTDATLVEGAPACGACAKNTAIQRDLFGARDAICLGVDCYRSKASHHAVRVRDRLVEAGGTVLDGAEAEAVMRPTSGFVSLASLCHEWARANPGKLAHIPTWGEVLDMSGHTDVAVTVALVTDHLGVTRVERVMRERDKARVLGNVDLAASEEAEADREVEDPDKRAAAEKREKRRAEVEEILVRRLCETVAEPAIAASKATEIAALALIDAVPSRVCEAVVLRRELAKRGADYAHALATAVRKDPEIAAGVVLELALVKGRDDIGSRAPSLVGEILEVLEIDVSEVRGEVKRDLDKRDEAEAAKRGQGRVRKRRARKGEQTELQSEAAGEEVAS